MLEQDWSNKSRLSQIETVQKGAEQFSNTKGYLVQASQA